MSIMEATVAIMESLKLLATKLEIISCDLREIHREQDLLKYRLETITSKLESIGNMIKTDKEKDEQTSSSECRGNEMTYWKNEAGSSGYWENKIK